MLSSSSKRLWNGAPLYIRTRSYASKATPPKPKDSTSPAPSSELPAPRLDYRSISENPTTKSTNASVRKSQIPPSTIPDIVKLYKESNHLSATLNAKRNSRSSLGERIRQSKTKEEKDEALEAAAKMKQEVKELEARLDEVERECLRNALLVPNDTHPDVPLGPEDSAVTVFTHYGHPSLGLQDQLSSTTAPAADSKKDHVRICEELDLVDFESASSIVSGSSFYFLRNEAALLEMALTNHAISLAIRKGFTPVTTPDVVRADVAARCGFQPRDPNSDDAAPSHMYHIASTHPSSPEMVLAGTSEIPLAGMFANKVYSSLGLPLKVVGVGHAFRQEAGARSAETRGLYRVHQFTKVELFAVTTAEASEGMMQELLEIQKEILTGLNLPFRILDMPSEELGASAYRKYDIEVWMPGRGTWGEVTSLSNCTDYQSRRLHIRYRPQGDAASPSITRLPFAHTLNGTAAAIPRLIVALLENGVVFGVDGKTPVAVRLPSVLRPFWIATDPRRKDVIQWQED